jgi:predicted nucleic acid-binding protein
MRINIKVFNKLNVIDTCSVWHLLSSDKLYNMAIVEKCYFSFTKYVQYECLHKPRTISKPEDERLREKLQKEIDKSSFQAYSISVDDLQSIMNLEERKALSKGELSSIVFAQKTRQAFLTDDQGARKLSGFYIGAENTQTIPHLFGWLSYIKKILDNEKSSIIQEHEDNGGKLSRYFEEVFIEAQRLLLMENNQSSGDRK